MTDRVPEKLMKEKWEYKKGVTGKGEPVYVVLFKELMYVHNLLLDSLFKENLRFESSWMIYDMSAQSKHHYQSLIPKGACPLCPILGEESCDKRPSDYVKPMLANSKYVASIWKTLFEKRIWEELLTEEMKKVLEEDSERWLRWAKYECEKWRDPVACRAVRAQGLRGSNGEVKEQ